MAGDNRYGQLEIFGSELAMGEKDSHAKDEALDPETAAATAAVIR